MPMINVSETDFTVIAGAAQDAFLRGDIDDANALDKVARKINAALANKVGNTAAGPFSRGSSSLTWKDVPSTLEHLKRLDSEK